MTMRDVLFIGALVAILGAGLLGAAYCDGSERDRLRSEGCEVVEKRTESGVTVCNQTGKVTVCQPTSRSVETWACPDGRRFER